MSSFNFNSAVLPANGDVITDLGIFENVKPRSDFFITPPRMHVEPSVEQAIKALQQHIKDYDPGWVEIVHRKLQIVQRSKKECGEEINEVRKNINDYRDQLESVQNDLDKNDFDIGGIRNEIADLNSEIDTEKISLENKKLDLEAVQSERDKAPTENEKKKFDTKISELTRATQDLEAAITKKRGQQNDLEDSLDKMLETGRTLISKKDSLIESIDAESKSLDVQENKYDNIEKDEDEIKRDYNDIKSKIDVEKIWYYKKKYGIGSSSTSDSYYLKSALMSAGITGEIGKTTQRLRRSSFDTNLKLLLSMEEFYVYCLYKAYKEESVKDADGLFNRVTYFADSLQNSINAEAARKFFYTAKLDKGSVDQEEYIAKVTSARFPYEDQKAKAFFKNTLNQLMTYGKLPKYVDQFFKKGELPPGLNTPAIKYKMVEHLHKLGLKVDGPKFDNGDYDEYFANAFTIAAKLDGSAQDPVKNVYSDVKVDNFDFDVDYFETIEEQSIDRQNILAAAVLFYNKVLADDLGILRIADAVIMAWTQGRLDIPQGETATKLYRYYKLRKERTTTEERAMFYKVVFNSGNAEVLENSVVNNEFGELWTTLMKETVKYIQKYETRENAIEYVSKVGVYNAIKNLQYNLSVFMSGMVKSLLPEMYAQLQSAIEILKQPEIVQQLGQGYHRNMWKVIERVSAEAFNIVPNVSALRTIAVKGHSIFKAMAQFDEAQFAEEDFRNFIGNVEEFIVANGQIEMKDYEGEEEGELVAEEKDEWDF